MSSPSWLSALQWSSAGFALLAAALWLWSALTPIPSAIRQIDFGHALDIEPKPVDDLDRLMAGLIKQSRLSSGAAVAAAVAAILQGLALLL